jgi:hypothetical protein
VERPGPSGEAVRVGLPVGWRLTKDALAFPHGYHYDKVLYSRGLAVGTVLEFSYPRLWSGVLNQNARRLPSLFRLTTHLRSTPQPTHPPKLSFACSFNEEKRKNTGGREEG